MDATTKGVRWVGNMCKKLQTKCADIFQEMDLIAQDHFTPVIVQEKIAGEVVEDFSSDDHQGLFADVDVVNDSHSDSSILYSSDASFLSEKDEDSVLNYSGHLGTQEDEDNTNILSNDALSPSKPIESASTVLKEVADELKHNLGMNSFPGQDHSTLVKEQEKIAGEIIRDISSEDLQDLYADADVVNNPSSDSLILNPFDACLLNERDKVSFLSYSAQCGGQEDADNMSSLFGNAVSPIEPASAVIEEVADKLKHDLDIYDPEVDAEENGLGRTKVYRSHVISNEMYFSRLSRRRIFGDNIYFPTSIYAEDLAGCVDYHKTPAFMESTPTNKPEKINSSSLVDGKKIPASDNAKLYQLEGIGHCQRLSVEDYFANETEIIHSSSLRSVNSKGSCTLETLTLSDTASASMTPLTATQSGTSDISKSTISFQSTESADHPMVDGIEDFTDIFLGETHLNAEENDAGEENAWDDEVENEIFFLYQQDAMRKSVSYKKKLQDALLAKWLSTKKRNNRTQAVLYRNKPDDNVRSFRNPDVDQTGSKKVVKHCFSEPGWEFI